MTVTMTEKMLRARSLRISSQVSLLHFEI